MKIRLTLLVCCALWIALPSPLTIVGQMDLESQKASVVKLLIHRAENMEETAAGLLVGWETQNAYFISACHALKKECLQPNVEKPPVRSVQVQFHGIQALNVEASIFDRYDQRLDLGVVRISISNLPSGLPQVARMDVSAGIPIRIIGHPAAGAWSVWRGDVQNETSASAVEKFVTSRDALLTGGYSGGPVFDLQGTFIGMHTETSGASFGLATKGGDIVRRLESWGVPTNNFTNAAQDLVAISKVLTAYEDSFKRLDAAAIWKIWPGASAETRKRIESYFASASSISRTLQLDPARIAPNGIEATVSGRFTEVFVPKGRSTAEPKRSDTISFRLKKAGGAWIITEQN